MYLERHGDPLIDEYNRAIESDEDSSVGDYEGVDINLTQSDLDESEADYSPTSSNILEGGSRENADDDLFKLESGDGFNQKILDKVKKTEAGKKFIDKLQGKVRA